MTAKDRGEHFDGCKSRTGHHPGIEQESDRLLTDAVPGTKTLGSRQKHSGRPAVKQDGEEDECVRDGYVCINTRNLDGEPGTNNHRHQTK